LSHPSAKPGRLAMVGRSPGIPGVGLDDAGNLVLPTF
jgi:hypothetical protein